MGAWDIGALQNDRALDWMYDLTDITGADLVDTVDRLLGSTNEEESFLAVSIIDAAVNGADRDVVGSFYEYEDWFKGLKGNKELIGLVPKAKKTISKLVKEGARTWFDLYKKDRIDLLKYVSISLKN